MDENMIASCGLYCGACKTYIASVNDTVGAYSQEMNIPAALLYCTGCRSENNCLFCRNCAIKKCCISKEIFTCTECGEFPCSVLKAFESDKYPHHKGVVDSLAELGKYGKVRWLETQKSKWSCKSCGETLSWYDEACPGCGSIVK